MSLYSREGEWEGGPEAPPGAQRGTITKMIIHCNRLVMGIRRNWA